MSLDFTPGMVRDDGAPYKASVYSALSDKSPGSYHSFPSSQRPYSNMPPSRYPSATSPYPAANSGMGGMGSMPMPSSASRYPREGSSGSPYRQLPSQPASPRFYGGAGGGGYAPPPSDHIYRQGDPARVVVEGPPGSESGFKVSRSRTVTQQFLKEFDEVEDMMEERVKMAEEASRALVNAHDSLHSESIVRGACVDPAPSRPPPPAAGAMPVSPTKGVQVAVAEKNDVRTQLRKALNDLQNVDSAVGGNPSAVIRQGQMDMEHLAGLRAAVESCLETLTIQLDSKEDELKDAQERVEASDMQIKTQREQMREMEAAMVELNKQLAQARAEAERVAREGAERLQRELEDQGARLGNQGAEDRHFALQQQEAQMKANHLQAMAAQERALEDRHTRILEERLSQYYHEVHAALAREKAEALQDLQSGLQRAADEALDHLRAEHTAERDRIVQALQRKIQAMEERHANEVDRIQREGEALLTRRLEEQKRALLMDTAQEQAKELRALENKLGDKNSGELEDLRASLARKHADELAATVAKQLAAQKKAMQDQHARDKLLALEKQKEELGAQHKEEMLRLKDELAVRHDRSLQLTNAKTQDLERKRTLREATQDRTSAMEKMQAEARREKTVALTDLREMMERKHAQEIETLRSRLEQVQREESRLRQDAHDMANDASAKLLNEQRSTQALKERLRQLLSGMKKSLAPRVDAPLDESASTPNRAIGSLAVLISSLSDKGEKEAHGMLPPPSAAAMSAPPVTVDVVLSCGEEMCEQMDKANNELEALKHQIVRERKLVRKQVEDELREENKAQLEALRVAMLKERDQEVEAQLFAAQHDATLKERRDRKEAELLRSTSEPVSPSPMRTTNRLPSPADRELSRLRQEHAVQEMERLRLEQRLAQLSSGGADGTM